MLLEGKSEIKLNVYILTKRGVLIFKDFAL